MKQAIVQGGITLKAIALTGVLMLAGCTKTSPPAADAIDAFTALADAEGDIETTLEVETVLSSQYTATDDLWKFRSPSKGVKGVSFGAPDALKTSSKVRLKGRTFKSRGVRVFVGMAQTETTASISGAAVTQSAPVVLMGDSQNFPAVKGTDVAMEELVLAWKPGKLNDMEIILFKRANGKPGIGMAFNGSVPSTSSLNTSTLTTMAGERRTTIKGIIKTKQTNVGPVATLEGYTATDDLWKFKSAVMLGWLVGEEDIQNESAK